MGRLAILSNNINQYNATTSVYLNNNQITNICKIDLLSDVNLFSQSW